MSFSERLKLENGSKSTSPPGKLFQRFTTRSAKKLHPNRAITEVLENLLCGWPLLKLDRNSKVTWVYVYIRTADGDLDAQFTIASTHCMRSSSVFTPISTDTLGVVM